MKSPRLLRLGKYIRYKDKAVLLPLPLEAFCPSWTVRIRSVAICLDKCSDPKGK